jgi:hypothetical protein
MSESNGDEKKRPRLILTFTPEIGRLDIDQENMPGPTTALSMLEIAKREFDFQWSVQRGMREQARMMQEQAASQLIRTAKH